MRDRDVAIVGLPTRDLGDTTWLIVSDGLGVLVDPQRDVERFLAAAAARAADVRVVVETHVHNDYLSGGPGLARTTGAQLVLPAAAGACYPHRPAFHGEPVVLAEGLDLVPLHTPGHTPEHTSYLLRVDGRALALFSGGSLLFGASGRTDLLGDGPARQLALAQHASLARLAALPGQVTLHPTHGQGSFCTSGAADRTASTIATERRENPVLAEPDPARWAEAHLAALGPFPAYYRHMRPLNLAGPSPLPGALRELTAEEAAAMADPPVAAGPGTESAPRNAAATVVERREPTGRRDGVWVVDARPREAFAAGHLPGALGVEWGQSFATWVGWLVPFDVPLVLVLEQDQDARAVQVALARIGVDRVLGVVRGLGRRADLGSFPLVDVAALDAALAAGRARQVLDVRAPAEWRDGHLPGALHRHLPDLVGGVDGLLDPAEDVWVACASGLRAVAAGSLLARHGFSPVVVGRGGIPDLVVG